MINSILKLNVAKIMKIVEVRFDFIQNKFHNMIVKILHINYNCEIFVKIITCN